jgi:hypothetical protein
LQFLLHETNPHEDLPELMNPLRDTDMPGAVCYRATPEVFGGYVRGSLGNVEGYLPESPVEYHDPGFYVNGRVYLNGTWRAERECIRWLGPVSDNGFVSMLYSGSALDVVLAPPEGCTAEVVVEQDGKFLTAENKGGDTLLVPDGQSILTLDMPRNYSVAKNREFGEHLLRLKPTSPGTALYSLAGLTSVIPDVFGSN